MKYCAEHLKCGWSWSHCSCTDSRVLKFYSRLYFWNIPLRILGISTISLTTLQSPDRFFNWWFAVTTVVGRFPFSHILAVTHTLPFSFFWILRLLSYSFLFFLLFLLLLFFIPFVAGIPLLCVSNAHTSFNLEVCCVSRRSRSSASHCGRYLEDFWDRLEAGRLAAMCLSGDVWSVNCLQCAW